MASLSFLWVRCPLGIRYEKHRWIDQLALCKVFYLEDGVRRLSGIVRKLLLLSLADAGRMNLYRVEVDLSHFLTYCGRC